MNLWARFKAWWEAGRAGGRMMHARKRQDRADASLAGASVLSYGAASHLAFQEHGTSGYQGPSGTDCGPGVSGDCGGTPV
jgi:hypothetical protein